MPLNRLTTRTFHRVLYATELEKITMLKRNDDQQQGTVRSLVLFQCRRSRLFKTGEPYQGDMSSSHRIVWHIPRIELDRAGVNYINALDRIIDYKGWWWQPESTTTITVKLFLNHLCIDCLRVDPPNIAQQTAGLP